MTVKDLIKKLQEVNPDAELQIIQEEELECMPELWDDEKSEVSGNAIELFSEDVHSHRMYLLAVNE